MLRRRNMELDSYNYELYNLAVEETTEHPFLFCPFARQCWGILGLDIPDDTRFLVIVSLFKDQLRYEFFMVAVILMSWAI